MYGIIIPKVKEGIPRVGRVGQKEIQMTVKNVMQLVMSIMFMCNWKVVSTTMV